MKKKLLLIVFAFSACTIGWTQPGGALDELEELTKDDKPQADYTTATFKGTRLINGQSIEMPAKGEMVLIFAHRFGSMENGLYDLFGLDRATMRMGVEYTPIDNVCIGIGRNTYRKTYDGFIKAKLIRQQKGLRNIPVTIGFLSGVAQVTDRNFVPNEEVSTASRLSFVNQLLIASKINSKFSIQVTPTIVHKNLVRRADEQNTFLSMGVGGRVKLSRRVSLNLEYFGLLPNQNVPEARGHSVRNTFAVGFDIETGGHVFQLQFTNAAAMYDGGYISETTTDFLAENGAGAHFGFNFTRTFTFGKKRKQINE
jgi:hypothetical protein